MTNAAPVALVEMGRRNPSEVLMLLTSLTPVPELGHLHAQTSAPNPIAPARLADQIDGGGVNLVQRMRGLVGEIDAEAAYIELFGP